MSLKMVLQAVIAVNKLKSIQKAPQAPCLHITRVPSCGDAPFMTARFDSKTIYYIFKIFFQ